MGYYRYIIYRILKSFIWSLKKNKKLIIFFLLFIFIGLLKSDVFAYSESFVYNDTSYASYIPDVAYNNFINLSEYKSGEYNFFMLCANGRAQCYFFKKTDDVKIWLTPGGQYTTSFDSNISNYGCINYASNENTGSAWLVSSNATSMHNSFYWSGQTWWFLTNVNFYTDSTCTEIFFDGAGDDVPPIIYTPPSFITTVSDFENIDNKNIKINGGSFSDNAILRLYNHTTNSIIINNPLSDYEDYLEREDLDNPFSDLIYNIPYSAFNSFNFLKDNEYEWRIVYTNENEVLSNVSLFFTPNLNESINDTTNKDINDTIKDTNEKLDNIEGSISDTNEKLDNLEDTVTDSDVNVDIESELPKIEIEDPTSEGINTIFNAFYNAFCTGEAIDIVFPIPYTEKKIRISPYYVRDMLNNNGVSWIYMFIQAYWAYIFGRFILKDISNKIHKIKSGDVETLGAYNVKEEML